MSKDRCEGYIPTWSEHPTEHSGKPTFHTRVRHRSGPEGSIDVVYPVAMGLPDEYNRTGHWWWAQVDPGNAEDAEHWSHFLGHQVLVDVEMRTFNERHVHDWKGYDEIRAAGYWKIFFNREAVWGDYCRDDILDTLDRIRQITKQLLHMSGPIDWRKPPYADQIVGRKLWYERTPAVVKYWFGDQGCIVLEPEGVDEFPAPAWARPDEGWDDRDNVKVHLTDDKIWWWRD